MVYNEEVTMMMSVVPGAMTGISTMMGGLVSINNVFMDMTRQIDATFGLIDTSIITASTIIAQLGLQAASAFGEFEQGLKIAQMVSNQTAQEMDYLRQKANEFSVSYRTDIDQITEGLQTLGRAGLNSASEQTEVLENGLSTAKLEARDLNGVLEELIQTTALLGGDLNSRNFGEDSGYVNDLLVATSMTAPITTHDVTETLKYSGGIAAAAGANIESDAGKEILEDYMGAIAAFAQKGVTGSIAGTALRAFFNKPATQDESVKDALATIHLKPEYLWEDDEETMKPISEQISIIEKQMKELDISTMDKLQIWSKIVGGKMGQQMMKLDSESIKELTRDIQAADDAGSLAAGTFDTYQMKMKEMTEQGQAAFRQFGEYAAKSLTPILEVLTKIFEFFSNPAVSFGVFVGAIGLIGMAISRVKNLFSELNKEFLLIKSALYKEEPFYAMRPSTDRKNARMNRQGDSRANIKVAEEYLKRNRGRNIADSVARERALSIEEHLIREKGLTPEDLGAQKVLSKAIFPKDFSEEFVKPILNVVKSSAASGIDLGLPSSNISSASLSEYALKNGFWKPEYTDFIMDPVGHSMEEFWQKFGKQISDDVLNDLNSRREEAIQKNDSLYNNINGKTIYSGDSNPYIKEYSRVFGIDEKSYASFSHITKEYLSRQPGFSYEEGMTPLVFKGLIEELRKYPQFQHLTGYSWIERAKEEFVPYREANNTPDSLLITKLRNAGVLHKTTSKDVQLQTLLELREQGVNDKLRKIAKVFNEALTFDEKVDFVTLSPGQIEEKYSKRKDGAQIIQALWDLENVYNITPTQFPIFQQQLAGLVGRKDLHKELVERAKMEARLKKEQSEEKKFDNGMTIPDFYDENSIYSRIPIITVNDAKKKLNYLNKVYNDDFLSQQISISKLFEKNLTPTLLKHIMYNEDIFTFGGTPIIPGDLFALKNNFVVPFGEELYLSGAKFGKSDFEKMQVFGEDNNPLKIMREIYDKEGNIIGEKEDNMTVKDFILKNQKISGKEEYNIILENLYSAVAQDFEERLKIMLGGLESRGQALIENFSESNIDTRIPNKFFKQKDSQLKTLAEMMGIKIDSRWTKQDIAEEILSHANVLDDSFYETLDIERIKDYQKGDYRSLQMLSTLMGLEVGGSSEKLINNIIESIKPENRNKKLEDDIDTENLEKYDLKTDKYGVGYVIDDPDERSKKAQELRDAHNQGVLFNLLKRPIDLEKLKENKRGPIFIDTNDNTITQKTVIHKEIEQTVKTIDDFYAASNKALEKTSETIKNDAKKLSSKGEAKKAEMDALYDFYGIDESKRIYSKKKNPIKIKGGRENFNNTNFWDKLVKSLMSKEKEEEEDPVYGPRLAQGFREKFAVKTAGWREGLSNWFSISDETKKQLTDRRGRLLGFANPNTNIKKLTNTGLNLIDQVGGPLMIAIEGVTIAIEMWQQAYQKYTEDLKKSMDDVKEAYSKRDSAENTLRQTFRNQNQDATDEEINDKVLEVYGQMYDDLTTNHDKYKKIASANAKLPNELEYDKEADDGTYKEKEEEEKSEEEKYTEALKENTQALYQANATLITAMNDVGRKQTDSWWGLDGWVSEASDSFFKDPVESILSSGGIRIYSQFKDALGREKYNDSGKFLLTPSQKDENYSGYTEMAGLMLEDFKDAEGESLEERWKNGLKQMMGSDAEYMSEFMRPASVNFMAGMADFSKNIGAERNARLQTSMKYDTRTWQRLSKEIAKYESKNKKTYQKDDSKSSKRIENLIKKIQSSMGIGFDKTQILQAQYLQMAQDMYGVAQQVFVPLISENAASAAATAAGMFETVTNTDYTGGNTYNTAAIAQSIASMLGTIAIAQSADAARNQAIMGGDLNGNNTPNDEEDKKIQELALNTSSGDEFLRKSLNQSKYGSWELFGAPILSENGAKLLGQQDRSAGLYNARTYLETTLMSVYGLDAESAHKKAQKVVEDYDKKGSSIESMYKTFGKNWTTDEFVNQIENAYLNSGIGEEGDGSGGSGSGDGDKDNDTGTRKERVDLVLCNRKTIPKLNVNLFKKPPSFTILNKNFKLRDVKINSEDKPKAIMAAIKNSFIDIQKRTDPKIIQDEDAVYDPAAATDGTNVPSGSAKTNTS